MDKHDVNNTNLKGKNMEIGLTVIADNKIGVLHKLTGVISKMGGNIIYTQQFIKDDNAGLIYMEIENVDDEETFISEYLTDDVLDFIFPYKIEDVNVDNLININNDIEI